MVTREDFSDLKPGDEVAINHGRYGGTDWRIHTVSRLTKGGNIVVRFGTFADGSANERIFYPNGSERGGDKYHWLSLDRLTDGLRQKIADIQERERLSQLVRRVKLDTVPLDKLRQIAAILQGE